MERMEQHWQELFSQMSWKVLPEDTAKACDNQLLAELVEPIGVSYQDELDQEVSNSSTSRKYTVAKKTTGEIVGEFDTLNDAIEVVAKAKRAKKQALVLL